MVYSEKLFVMKAKTANIGATLAHHIYSSMKRYDLVHGQVADFKKYIRELNCFIGEGDS